MQEQEDEPTYVLLAHELVMALRKQCDYCTLEYENCDNYTDLRVYANRERTRSATFMVGNISKMTIRIQIDDHGYQYKTDVDIANPTWLEVAITALKSEPKHQFEWQRKRKRRWKFWRKYG